MSLFVVMADKKAPQSAEELLQRYADGERYFVGANLVGADLEGANLEKAYLEKADLRGANLEKAYLSRTGISEADLQGANLEKAYLRGANLVGADLWGAFLRGADLRGANLLEARIHSLSLRGAIYKPEDLLGIHLLGEKQPKSEEQQAIETWMANPATIKAKLSGDRIANLHHLYFAAALEHFYCSAFTILHRPYENEEELNRALVSPYAEVPQQYRLVLSAVNAGSIIIDYKLIQTVALVLGTIGTITWAGYD